VPSTITADSLNIQVTFDSGPLAGPLEATQLLTIGLLKGTAE